MLGMPSGYTCCGRVPVRVSASPCSVVSGEKCVERVYRLFSGSTRTFWSVRGEAAGAIIRTRENMMLPWPCLVQRVARLKAQDSLIAEVRDSTELSLHAPVSITLVIRDVQVINLPVQTPVKTTNTTEPNQAERISIAQNRTTHWHATYQPSVMRSTSALHITADILPGFISALPENEEQVQKGEAVPGTGIMDASY
ncbi:hypothetical protein IRJ41_007781 [Triplophysa rosa]|uniref:Uncharacterized protein n=1 Tax=Triplophysa rosa TaxID=992332 RepID=A0A9W7TVH1_TRIRA|nr:hypothetical protein IRJ41_007781 [Triplophysa rosa]